MHTDAQVRELTADELNAVSGAGRIGPFYSTENSVGIDVPGFHLGFVLNGEGGININYTIAGHSGTI
jgi:hypothetical protein